MRTLSGCFRDMRKRSARERDGNCGVASLAAMQHEKTLRWRYRLCKPLGEDLHLFHRLLVAFVCGCGNPVAIRVQRLLVASGLGKCLPQHLPRCGVRGVECDRLLQVCDRRAGVAGPEILETEPKAKQCAVLAAVEQLLQTQQSGARFGHWRINSPLAQSTRRMG